jgi:anti-sigma B factor antagonist
VKEFGEVRVRKGEKLLVVDLQDCSGMDSTFMGTLAGLANRLKENGGELEVADAGEKNRASLEDLGLDFLMEIEPEEAVWKGLEDKARDFLKLKVAGMRAGTQMHTRHILEAHQLLSEANEGNQEKFSGVVSLLEKQVAEKEKG